MIAHLRGTLIEKTPHYAVIEAGGVGYRVFITLAGYEALPHEGEGAALHIVTIVREDALHLYGFPERGEKEMFLLLTSVTRIGPRLACSILSGVRPDALRAAVTAGDKTRLAKVPNVGAKTAERIIMELKDKFGPAAISAAPHTEGERTMADALAALLNLGYQKKDAEKALLKTMGESPNADLADLLKRTLKLLSL